MAGYQDVSEFERVVTASAREMGHSISEVVMKFGFSLTTISRVYCEYPESDFNAGPSIGVTVQTIQRNIIDIGFRSQRPTRIPLLTARYKDLHLAWARQQRHWTVKD
ncbi:HTH_Tnp_Tc3_2 domain-containing protein [Trichonephila clavipes]|uniref:HTH_Tnp_Tc3_2 domain-containing protein n=1 Tax=Trichonephila clavipes TaxID=2585209 RepID=A0A8X6V9W3_TRICX|nr:HTH_Tnp_Tc3_2 domain-containing protein [Trichonephila clavipes]